MLTLIKSFLNPFRASDRGIEVAAFSFSRGNVLALGHSPRDRSLITANEED
jgi:hypothetical protein